MRMSVDYLEYSIKTLQEVQRDLAAASAFQWEDCLMWVEHVACFINETNRLLKQEHIDISAVLPRPDWLSLELRNLIDSGQGISFAHFQEKALSFVAEMTRYMQMWKQRAYSTL